MPIDTLANLPNGSDAFLDANIFIYALTGISSECESLLKRCARNDVFGVASFEVINEVTHRLIVGEAYAKGLIARPRAEELRQKPAAIQGLQDYWTQVEQIFNMNLVVVTTE
jgi:predicted nucleic acid-binding protein